MNELIKNVKLNSGLSKQHDFIYAVDSLYNGDEIYDKRIKGLSLKPDTRVVQGLKLLWENIDESTPGLALFVGHGKGRKGFMWTYFMHSLLEYGSIDAMIDRLEYMDSSLLQQELLKHYDSKSREERFYQELIGDMDRLYSYINSLDNDALQKWELTVLMNNPDEIMAPFLAFCREIGKRIGVIYRNNNLLFKSLEKRLTMKITNNPEYFMNTELKVFTEHMSPYESGEIVISYSFFREYFGLSLGGIKNRIIILGFHYDNSLKLLAGPIEVLGDEEFFKAFGDKTRLKIIKLLLQRKMYVGEIARHCNLRISTISYHLEVMSQGGLVGKDMAKNHVYYMINNSHIRERLKNLIELFK